MSQNGAAYRSHAQFFDNPLCNKNKKAAENQLLFAYRVELEGIEPSSAQGNHTLSTCLFQPSIFEV